MMKAPWTDAEVETLNAYQNACEYHPYTCPGDYPECEKQRNLVATNDGWVCQCGKYKQEWVHADMIRHDKCQNDRKGKGNVKKTDEGNPPTDC